MDPWVQLLIVIGVVALAAVIVVIWLVTREWPASTGAEGMIGKPGVVVDGLAPTGQVMIEGEYWKARGDCTMPPGAPVVVRGVKGLVLLVSPADED